MRTVAGLVMMACLGGCFDLAALTCGGDGGACAVAVDGTDASGDMDVSVAVADMTASLAADALATGVIVDMVPVPSFHDLSPPAPPDLSCGGSRIAGGACFVSACPSGYVWTHAEAEAACAARGMALCTVEQVRSALAAGADSCCVGWTATPCEGGYLAAYPFAPSSNADCTHGTNETCAAASLPFAANCCN